MSNIEKRAKDFDNQFECTKELLEFKIQEASNEISIRETKIFFLTNEIESLRDRKTSLKKHLNLIHKNRETARAKYLKP